MIPTTLIPIHYTLISPHKSKNNKFFFGCFIECLYIIPRGSHSFLLFRFQAAMILFVTKNDDRDDRFYFFDSPLSLNKNLLLLSPKWIHFVTYINEHTHILAQRLSLKHHFLSVCLSQESEHSVYINGG